MAIPLPTELKFRLGELGDDQGFDLDKQDQSWLPGPQHTLNPVSLISYEESLPENINRVMEPGQNGAAFANGDPKTRGPRTVRMKLGIHDGRDDSIPLSRIRARDAMDELNYWLFNNMQENKLHVWDNRYVNYYMNGYKWKFMNGTPANNYDIDAELVCADPFNYYTGTEGAEHTWDTTMEWSGGSSGRGVGDEVVFPYMSVRSISGNIDTGVHVNHKELMRTFAYVAPILDQELLIIDFSNFTAHIIRPGNKVIEASRYLRGTVFWLLPDGNTNTIIVEPKYRNRNNPGASNIQVLFTYRPRFQI